MKEIYVTGHRNPDTDAICSAISVAALEELQGREAIACRQGPLNEETKFVLKRFHQEHPFLLTDARLTLAEIELDEPVLLTKDATAHEAWRAMKHSQYIPICHGKRTAVRSSHHIRSVCLPSGKPGKAQ